MRVLSSHCPMRMILLMVVLLGAIAAMAEADNRYCGPGDMARFGAEKDGPAALPTRCINTSIASTPSSGRVITVSERDAVEQAVEQANCGDTIQLRAGATFAPFRLVVKHCDAAHWITIRTSAADSALPPEGTRLTPCYAGVASLTGRPRYDCPQPKNVLAKIELKSGAGAIIVPEGANHYRLIGLEITRTPQTAIVYGLVKFEGSGDHIVIDRCWIHGSELDETTRGIYLGSSSYVGVVDSYFTDFHCIARTGACTDAQAIAGGNGRTPMGIYKIVNNYMEGAAETVLFGGAGGSVIPSDIEVRRNYMYKPLTWMPGHASFVGKAFIVKNLFELKNAERVLFEGNVLENSWGGFSQIGYGILLTPRGSWAAVQDVTIRYSVISGTAAGIQMAASKADTGDSLAAQRWSIHDVLIRDLDAKFYNGDGVVFQLTSGFVQNAPLNNVSIDHVTVVPKTPVKNLILFGNAPGNPRSPFNIRITNNILPGGRYSVWNAGGSLCAKSGNPEVIFDDCWKPSEVRNNVIYDYPGGQGPWPRGNFLPKDLRAVGFLK